MTNGTMDAAKALDSMLHTPGDGGRVVWFGSARMTIKVAARDTGGAFSLVEVVAPAGWSPPLHIQHDEEEAFLVLEGTMTFRCGERTVTAGPGSVTVIPRGVPHTFVVEGSEPARFLNLATPGGVDEFFIAGGREPEHDGMPPLAPPDIELMRRVSEQFGAEIVGPPLAPRGLR